MKEYKDGYEEYELSDYPADDNEENTPENEGENKKRTSVTLLTIIQISVCSILLIAAVIIRIGGGDTYNKVRSWYIENINKSIVPEEQMNNVKERVIDLFPTSSESQAVSEPQPSSGVSQAQQAVSSQGTASAQDNAPSQPAASDNAAASSNGTGSVSSQPVGSQAVSSSGQQGNNNAASKTAASVPSQSLIE
ncbi:MAG TPA: hypothetical protein GXX74_09085 [Clostridiales bacterium]|nr:hypothetical protein [Clostridiales bacterium]